MTKVMVKLSTIESVYDFVAVATKAECDVDINSLSLQYEEVKAVKWATLDEILQMIKSGEFIPYHESFIELLFYLKDNRVIRTSKDKTSDN